MEAGLIMPTIHFKCPRDDMVAIHEGRIKIVTEVTKFEGGYIGVNSFGFGGANSHILLKSNPKTKVNNSTSNDNLPILLAISGRTEEAIKIILDDVRITMCYYLHLSLHYGLTFLKSDDKVLILNNRKITLQYKHKLRHYLLLFFQNFVTLTRRDKTESYTLSLLNFFLLVWF